MITWYVIYTTSAFECPWCVKAKELLQVYGIDYFEKDIHTNETYKREFLEQGFRKVPQVFREDVLIGGHDSLQEYLRNTTAGAKDEKLSERLTRI